MPPGDLASSTECLADGCYALIVQDSYGDGLFCGCGEGNYELTDAEGTVLATEASFADSDVTEFCLESDGRSGRCVVIALRFWL